MIMEDNKFDCLRLRLKDYKARSRLTYKVIAEQMNIPYNSFRNFMYGVKISEERYDHISSSLDIMESKLPW
jgi:hypothetical protein